MTRTPTSILLGADAPRIVTVPMLAAALSHKRKRPARGTLFKWIREQTASGVLRPVTRGLYINQLARPVPPAAEAAGYVRAGAIVSLQTVLGEAGVTNSYSDIITSVIPIHGGVAGSSRPVVAGNLEFRFPLDIDLDRLNKTRLARLAKYMGLSSELRDYLSRKRRYDEDPDVRANAPTDLR